MGMSFLRASSSRPILALRSTPAASSSKVDGRAGQHMQEHHDGQEERLTCPKQAGLVGVCIQIEAAAHHDELGAGVALRMF